MMGVVYHLILEDEIVYVGQSNSLKSMVNRIKSHKSNKAFDSTAFKEVDNGDLDDFEALDIVKFAPKYNKTLPPGRLTLSVNQLSRLAKLKISKDLEENKVTGKKFGVVVSDENFPMNISITKEDAIDYVDFCKDERDKKREEQQARDAEVENDRKEKARKLRGENTILRWAKHAAESGWWAARVNWKVLDLIEKAQNLYYMDVEDFNFILSFVQIEVDSGRRLIESPMEVPVLVIDEGARYTIP